MNRLIEPLKDRTYVIKVIRFAGQPEIRILTDNIPISAGVNLWYKRFQIVDNTINHT